MSGSIPGPRIPGQTKGCSRRITRGPSCPVPAPNSDRLQAMSRCRCVFSGPRRSGTREPVSDVKSSAGAQDTSTKRNGVDTSIPDTMVGRGRKHDAQLREGGKLRRPTLSPPVRTEQAPCTTGGPWALGFIQFYVQYNAQSPLYMPPLSQDDGLAPIIHRIHERPNPIQIDLGPFFLQHLPQFTSILWSPASNSILQPPPEVFNGVQIR
ncbi:hypothetical protein BU16DRAFT_598722 [Lophium mytilinum]|uniref:Uncharacterized protein n=1 Tax=Lophium mytilinum TaxID=390894 RepID=A0A6A6RB65_9PEZI|nr:hypothetical protein BU16DRAFT_598722 [Lophium mytilinum]